MYLTQKTRTNPDGSAAKDSRVTFNVSSLMLVVNQKARTEIITIRGRLVVRLRQVVMTIWMMTCPSDLVCTIWLKYGRKGALMVPFFI